MEIKKELYDYEFYASRDEKTRHVADKILKILSLYDIEIESVADIGGGVGTFLKAAKEFYHLKDDQIFLFEGDYIDRTLLVVDEKSFISCDLEKSIDFKARVSIAFSLEVAEHLSPKRAESFVGDLVRMSDCIVFSAAAKYQGGENHVNEQRLGYWVDKFMMYDYIALDIFRPRLQYDLEIPFWYRQNVVMFVKKDSVICRNITEKPACLQPLDMITYEMVQSRLDTMNDFGKTFLFRTGHWLYRHIRRKKIEHSEEFEFRCD